MRSSQLHSRQALARIAAITILFTFALVTGGANAEAQKLKNWRAGTVGFAAGQAGIGISFSFSMPSTDYAVLVQPTNTAGYSPTSVCTYFNVLHKTVDGFEVQHKRCDDGTPVALDVNVSLDWMAVKYK